jgi:hypothetical protein
MEKNGKGEKLMNRIKKSLSFNRIIYITVLSFVIIQLHSLSTIKINLISTKSFGFESILYILSSILLISLMIFLFYYLPILCVISVYLSIVNFRLQIDLKPMVTKKIDYAHANIIIKTRIYRKLQVIRC